MNRLTAPCPFTEAVTALTAMELWYSWESKYQVNDLSESGFYKLSDRKFVMTGDNIRDDQGAVQTSGWAYLVGDKSGNVQVINENLDMKVLDSKYFDNGNMRFTIKDETLDLGLNRTVNLAQVMGSLQVVEDPYNLGQKVYAYTIRGGDGGSGGIGGTGGTGGIGGTGGRAAMAALADTAETVEPVALVEPEVMVVLVEPVETEDLVDLAETEDLAVMVVMVVT